MGLLCALDLPINGFAQITVDKAESGASITDRCIASSSDDLACHNCTRGIDFPESTVVDDWDVERRCSVKLLMVNVSLS
jgi:hypothetical protein